MNETQAKVVRYYTKPTSRFGYNFVLWGAKHFGYYPTGKPNISEREAQNLYHDLVADKLNLAENQTILDAGCGQGVVSTYLAKKFRSRIFGVTLVPYEVQKAKKLADELGVSSKTNYQVMDYSQTTFQDDFFDAIYTTESLSHSPYIVKTLKEFYRVLKPGGRFAFFEYSVAPDEQFTERETKMLNIVIEGSAMMGLKSFRFDKFSKVLENTGFIDVSEENITENFRPSAYRLYKFARLPYILVRLFRLQRVFVNTTAGYECYKMADKGLLRYSIFTGRKKA